MTTNLTDPKILNRLLKALPEAEYAKLVPHFEHVRLEFGDVIQLAEDPITYVFFPETAVVSMLSIMADGSTTEVGLVGNEGILGVRVLLGLKKTPHSAIVQVAGTAMRMSAKALGERFESGSPTLLSLTLCYTEALLAQARQCAACSIQHTISQRLARWLLAMADYTDTDELKLTHELIATLIGSRRAGISVFLSKFQEAEMIEYTRGHLTILDRPRLEAAACECYRIMRQEVEQLYAAA